MREDTESHSTSLLRRLSKEPSRGGTRKGFRVVNLIRAHHPHCTKRGRTYLPRVRGVTQVGYGSGLLIRRTSTRFRWFESSTPRHTDGTRSWRAELPRKQQIVEARSGGSIPPPSAFSWRAVRIGEGARLEAVCAARQSGFESQALRHHMTHVEVSGRPSARAEGSGSIPDVSPIGGYLRLARRADLKSVSRRNATRGFDSLILRHMVTIAQRLVRRVVAPDIAVRLRVVTPYALVAQRMSGDLLSRRNAGSSPVEGAIGG